VRGDLHIGGVMIHLVDSLGKSNPCKNQAKFHMVVGVPYFVQSTDMRIMCKMFDIEKQSKIFLAFG
jgi:hypothetical protein